MDDTTVEAIAERLITLHGPVKEEVELWLDEDGHDDRFPECPAIANTGDCQGHAFTIEVCQECGYLSTADYEVAYRPWPCATHRAVTALARSVAALPDPRPTEAEAAAFVDGGPTHYDWFTVCRHLGCFRPEPAAPQSFASNTQHAPSPYQAEPVPAAEPPTPLGPDLPAQDRSTPVATFATPQTEALAREMAEAWGRSDPADNDDIWLFCATVAVESMPLRPAEAEPPTCTHARFFTREDGVRCCAFCHAEVSALRHLDTEPSFIDGSI